MLAERLSTASMAITSTLNIGRILDQVLDQLQGVIAFDTASIQRFTPNGFYIIACAGFSYPEHVKRLIFPLDTDFPNTFIYRRRKAKFINDVQSEYPHFTNPYWHATHIRSWLGAPSRSLICLENRFRYRLAIISHSTEVNPLCCKLNWPFAPLILISASC